MTKIQINNTIRDMTAEEQAEFDARQVTPLSALEQSLSDLRQKRNKLLQQCDWIELNNSPLTSSKKKLGLTLFIKSEKVLLFLLILKFLIS